MAFVWPIRVYIEDTDFGGLVYYVNHLKFMERARTECVRVAGWSQAELAEAGIIFVVSQVEASYQQPARLDQELCVHTEIKQTRGARVRFLQRIVDAFTEQTLSTAVIDVVCVDSKTMKPKRWPKELITTMRARVPQAWSEQE